MASAEILEGEDEEIALFDKEHYPKGVNADFFRDESEDGSDVIEKFGGEKGLFEDTERRDIAAAVPDVVKMIKEKTSIPSDGVILDVGAGTGLFLKPLSSLVPDGQLFASDISPEFRTYLESRIQKEQLLNTKVLEADSHNAALIPSTSSSLPSFHTVLLIDVYHHLEYPRTICRKLRKQMCSDGGRLIVIDFYRDPLKVISRGPDWVMQHLRAGQDEFRNEILSSGFALVEEPLLDALKENYVMIFRPCTEQEMGNQIGAGWANKPVSANPLTMDN